MNIIKLPDRISLIGLLPNGSTIAEVGVWRGYLTTKILDLPNFAHVFAIDSWKPRPEYHDPLENDDHENNLRETLHNVRGHIPGGRLTIVRADSLDAAKQFLDAGRTLDAVYLDADHSYQAVLDDLRAWSKVVKPDGYILGHDYTHCPKAIEWKFGVIEAVETFCKESPWKMKYITSEEFASFGLVQV